MLLHPSVLLWLASAQIPAPPAVDVRWQAPPECPDRAALLDAVARRLGRPLAVDEARVDAAIAGDARQGYTLHLELTVGSRGEARDVADPACAPLVDAAALRVVAAIAAAPAEPEPEPEPVTPEPEPAAPEPAAPPIIITPVPKAIPAQRGPGGLLRLHGGLELGALPGTSRAYGPAGAGGLALGLLWPRLRIELHATVVAPRTGRGLLGEVRAGLFTAGVQACARPGRGALEVPLCGGLELGGLRGEARELASGAPNTGFWLAAVLGPGVVWRVSPRVGVWAGLQLVLAPVRPRFEAGAGQEAMLLYKPSPASGRLLLGVELRLRDRW